MSYPNVGNKAFNLMRIRDETSLNVPIFCATGYDFFYQILESSQSIPLIELSYYNKENQSNYVHEISHAIRSTKFSTALKNYVDNIIENLQFPIAIRSSASIEDSRRSSFAGQFDTKLYVNKGEVCEAIKSVIASLYTENLIFLVDQLSLEPKDYYMGIIFQEMIFAEKSGVLFTQHPISKNQSVVYIEEVEGAGEQLASGKVRANGYILEKKNEGYCTYHHSLIDAAIILERLFGCHVDVEWCYLNKKLYILQARPIIDKKEFIRIINNFVFHMHDLNSETYRYLFNLKNRYGSYQKKKNLYKFCEENNIVHLEWKFIVYSDKNLENLEINRFIENNNLYIVSFNQNRPLLKKVDDIKKELIKYSLMNKSTNQYCVSLREHPLNKYAVLSYVSGSNIVLEVAKGKVRWINVGDITPTKYILNQQNEVIEENIKKHYEYVFDFSKMAFDKCNILSETKLSKKLLSRISSYTRLLDSRFKGNIFEWWVVDEEQFYCSDMTEVEDNAKIWNINSISPGYVDGVIVKLDNIPANLLKEINTKSKISIHDSNKYRINNKFLRDFYKKIKKYKKINQKIILLCEKPYLFITPLIREVDGIVFKEASKLCHLSIIIREMGIPAIEVSNFEELKTGDLYIIDS